jgi:dipeptidyl aminopeptidase/acylaminoacyl peptidase
LLVCVLVGAAKAEPANVTAPKSAKDALKKEDLTLEKIFPKQGLFGPSATDMAFSHDGKHAAYLYRSSDERRQGNDLWLLDVAAGKTSRLTSLELMARFQDNARKAKEGLGKRTKDGAGTEIDGQSRDERGRGFDRPGRYNGVSSFTWSPSAQELLFTSEGDIYRWKLGDKEPARLTRTRTAEASVQYLKDGQGYTYLRDGALMKVAFGSHLLEQLDPSLPGGESLNSYKISPDGKHLAFLTRKGSGPFAGERKVSIASYRERFMKATEVPRLVSDDPQPSTEVGVYLYDLTDPMIENGTLSQVFTHKYSGPRDGVSMPDWSLDSRRITFSVFEQSSGQVRILTAEVSADPKPGAKREKAKAAKVVHRFLHTGGPTTPNMVQPRFLDDHRRIVLVSEQTGYRHLHVLDPLYESIEPVTFGRCEVYPVALSKDRKTYFVAATKEHPSCRDVYRVNLTDRTMDRLTRQAGCYEDVAVSPDGKTVLANYSRFGALKELVRLDAGNEGQVVLTKSHSEAAHKYTAARPEFFTFANRHGHEIHGMLFKPEGFAKADKRPLLVYVYGGPLGTRKNVVEGNFQSDAYFFAWYMAAKHGYVTCTIDPRGMSGYGSLFEKANYEQVGRPQVEDLVDGVKHLIAGGGIDPKKVGIHGWSFGGFQTQMCLYTEPDVFAVGIAGAGPTEWENYNSWYSTGTIGPSRTGQPDLSKFSLLPLAKGLKGRLLLVHGMEDSNVLYQDTVRVYRELLKAGKGALVDLFLDPTGGHGLGGDVDRAGRYGKYEDFLLRHLGTGSPATSTTPSKLAGVW